MINLICPKCNTENEDIAKFCRICGSPIERQSNIEAEDILSTENTVENNIDQDDVISDNKEVLEINSIDVNGVNNKANNGMGKTQKGVLIAVLVTVILALLIAFIYMLSSKAKQNYPEDYDDNTSSYGSTVSDDDMILSRDGSLILDSCNLLSEEYKNSLEKRLEELSNDYQMDIAVVIEDSIGECVYENNLGENNAFLTLSLNPLNVQLASSGNAIDALSDNAMDNLNSYFDNGDWSGGFDCFVNNCAICLSAYENDEIPEELKKYSDRLEEENRWYVVKLSQDDWKIKIRSTPEYFAGTVANDNTIGLIQSGTEIYVEYICDGTWAVYQMDGRYVFSSLYDVNDASKSKLILPK